MPAYCLSHVLGAEPDAALPDHGADLVEPLQALDAGLEGECLSLTRLRFGFAELQGPSSSMLHPLGSFTASMQARMASMGATPGYRPIVMPSGSAMPSIDPSSALCPTTFARVQGV
jgi:hypothetical protein